MKVQRVYSQSHLPEEGNQMHLEFHLAPSIPSGSESLTIAFCVSEPNPKEENPTNWRVINTNLTNLFFQENEFPFDPSKIKELPIRFRQGTTELIPDSIPTIDLVVRVLHEHPKIHTIAIWGIYHPSAKKTLAEERARVIKQKLEERGIAPECMVVKVKSGEPQNGDVVFSIE
jgi:outer membrane protein OmpA-like peptidoglycan-associated protein